MDNKELEVIYSKAKKSTETNFLEYLQIIYESNNSYWNYRVALLCMTEKRIPSQERIVYVIKHAEVIFKNNDLELIIKFINNISNKPSYQDFLKTKKSIKEYEQELARQKEKNKQEDAKRQKTLNSNSSIPTISDDKTDLEKSNIILKTNNPEWHYYAIANLKISLTQKQHHLQAIIKSAHPYWNYKCIKSILRITTLTKEEKKALISPHIFIVYDSDDLKTKEELANFLKYTPIQNKVNKRKKTFKHNNK